MQVSISTFVFIVLVSAVFLSCTTIEIPSMDSKVVSYRRIGDWSEQLLPESWKNGFILGRDTLERWFPHIFNDWQAESGCNYFAIYFATSSTLIKYWVLSQDMALYEIKPGNARECAVSDDAAYHAMLVCDDTEEGNLKDKIDLSSIRSYTDEDWNCKKGRKNVFF